MFFASSEDYLGYNLVDAGSNVFQLCRFFARDSEDSITKINPTASNRMTWKPAELFKQNLYSCPWCLPCRGVFLKQHVFHTNILKFVSKLFDCHVLTFDCLSDLPPIQRTKASLHLLTTMPTTRQLLCQAMVSRVSLEDFFTPNAAMLVINIARFCELNARKRVLVYIFS